MTEKKPRSTVQQEQTQGFNSPAEDEIDLIDFLKFLARKKVLILAVTSVCTLFAIFYAQSITPNYRATVELIANNGARSSFSFFRQLDPTLANKISKAITKPYSIFERFLLKIKSYEFKQEVFVNGGFQKKFSSETGIGTDQSVSKIFNSIEIVKRDGVTNLELDGSKPKVMLEFLTALVESAKEDVNTETNVIKSSIVKTRIDNLSKQKQAAQLERQIEEKEREMEIEGLLQAITLQKQIEKKEREMEIKGLLQAITLQKKIEKKEREREIDRLSRALVIAKRMGIKNHNFTKSGSHTFPLWFLYGELGLQQEIMGLTNTETIPAPRLEELEAELKLKRFQQEKKQQIRRSGEKNPNTKTIPMIRLQSELKLKRFQQEKKQQISRLRIKKEEISKPDNLIIKKIDADLPLLKFKVATISKKSYSLVKPYQTLVIVGFGVAFGLFISIVMAFLIDPKQLGAKETQSASA